MFPKGGEGAMKTVGETSPVATTNGSSPPVLLDMDGWVKFARNAEEAGIESTLLSFRHDEPDPFFIACAVGLETARLKFIAAYPTGLMQPAAFVQQVNTLSCLIGGRVALNIIAGNSAGEQRSYGDFPEQGEQYERADEYLRICNSFWSGAESVDFDGKYFRLEHGRVLTPFVAPDRAAPEIYVSGRREQAWRLALKRGSCCVRPIDTPENLVAAVTFFRDRGVEVCLRLCVICRPTRDEAIDVAASMLPDGNTDRKERAKLSGNDSRTLKQALAPAGDASWLNRNLWTAMAPYWGSSAITLLGSPPELAARFLEYKRIGVSQFIVAGWPNLDEMIRFGREVLPLVRDLEADGPPTSKGRVA
jgi:alkanesulfonate monooxygenase